MNNRNSNNTVVAGAGSGKKFIAIVLVAVMCVMWLRAFKKGPAKAAAAVLPVPTAKVADDKANASIGLEYVALDVTAGRNDVVSNDIFAVKSWVKEPTGIDKVLAQAENSNETVLNAASVMSLTAIIAAGEDGKAEAFIDDKLVSVGSVVEVVNEGRLFEFAVTDIEKSKVTMMSKGVIAVLSISPDDK